MKVHFILFLLFLSVSNCKDELVQIPWNGTSMTNLNTDGTNYFYVAISNSRTYGTFELYFEDYDFCLCDDLYYVKTYYVPDKSDIYNYTFSNSYRYSERDFYSSVAAKYYFTISYNKYSDSTLYFIFKYYGDYSSGSLRVKCTNDDSSPPPTDSSHTDSSRTDSSRTDSSRTDSTRTDSSHTDYYQTDSYSTDKVAKVVGSTLSVVAIVFIVIGSLIGLGILITVIVFVCICTRKKTTYGSVGFINPQQPPNVVASNTLTTPLNPPNLYPNIYPNTNLYPNTNSYPNTKTYPNTNTNPNPNTNSYANTSNTTPSTTPNTTPNINSYPTTNPNPVKV